MLKNIFLRTALWVGCTAPLCAASPQTLAQEVLDRLYATNGNYTFKKPALVLSAENKKVAAYSPWKNTILLDEKAYQICRGFGRDSLSALAYILGHELVHAYQATIEGQRLRTNFLAYQHAYKADIRVEKGADIQGLFNAYLAGYGVLTSMPEVIERIYREYGLLGKSLAGYPSLDERKATCREVLEIAQNLLDVFESCNYLLVMGQNSLACTGYEYILQYYQGLEIYNNLGMAYTLNAQQFWNPKTDNFVYPLEADWSSKLSRAAAARGQENMDPTMEPLRQAFLDKALANFREATRLNPDYLAARINTVCALDMQGRPVEALKYAELNLLKTPAGKKKRVGQEADMIEIALGITYALQPGGRRKAEALAIFNRLSASPNALSALYARQNRQFIDGQPDTGPAGTISLPPALRQAASQLQLGRTSALERMPLDAAAGIYFARKRGPDSATVVFSNSQGNLVSLLRFQNRRPDGSSVLDALDDRLDADAFRNVVGTRDGFYLKSPADQVVLKVNTRGQVLEMVKYIEHGR